MTTDNTATQQTADNSTATQQSQQQSQQQGQQQGQESQQQTTEKWSTKWGDTWREDAAKEYATNDKGELDQGAYEKSLTRFRRFNTPRDVFSWGFNAEKKISDGSYKKPIGDKATAEEVAEYRKANGIPDEPAKYFESLPNGLVIGDEDKPIFDGLAKQLHGIHTEPKVMHAIADWYYKLKEDTDAKMQEANASARQDTEDALRNEWGQDYRANTNLVKTFLGSMPKDVQEELFKSVTPDGKQILNNPKMVNWLAQQARELNYTGATSTSGESDAKTLDGEINSLKTMMGDRKSAYWKGPEAEKNQARYRDLLELKDRIKSRAA